MKLPLVLSLFVAFPLFSQAKPLVLGVIADVNGSACQTKYPATSLTAFDQLLANHALDHIVMTGDATHGECMNYKGKPPYQAVAKAMWEEFDEKFFRPARAVEGVDIVLAPGNHDAPYLYPKSREGFRTENAEFVRYWQNNKPNLTVEMVELPNVSDNYPYYWAYFYQDVLFIVLHNTRTHTLADGVRQKEWLRAVLQSPRAQAARARIAFGHVPPYAVLDPSVGGKYKEIIQQEQVGAPNSLLDLFLDHGLDLLMVGHSHAPYPAELTRLSDNKTMKILSMPCGHAPRKLLSKKELSPRGYAVVEVGDDNKITLGVYNWADGKIIPAAYFPASIPVKGGKITYQRLKELP